MEGNCNMAKNREVLAPGYIMEALLLLMESTPYPSISISAICKKAGVARTTFYRNFSRKEDVLAGWIDEVTDRFLSASNISFSPDSIEDYFVKLMEHMRKYKAVCLRLYQNGLLHLVQQKFDQVFLEKYCSQFGKYTCAFFSGAVFGVYILWLKKGGTLLPEQLARQIQLSDLRDINAKDTLDEAAPGKASA